MGEGPGQTGVRETELGRLGLMIVDWFREEEIASWRDLTTQQLNHLTRPV